MQLLGKIIAGTGAFLFGFGLMLYDKTMFNQLQRALEDELSKYK